jgi:hypothetical protein
LRILTELGNREFAEAGNNSSEEEDQGLKPVCRRKRRRRRYGGARRVIRHHVGNLGNHSGCRSFKLVTHVPQKSLEFIPCQEDDLFAKELEAMMMEDRENRKVDPLLQSRTANALKLNIPMGLVSPPTPHHQQAGPEGVPYKVFLSRPFFSAPSLAIFFEPPSIKRPATISSIFHLSSSILHPLP